MTLRSLIREFVVSMRVREDAHNRDATLAFMIEVVRRQKRPSLKALLAKRDVKQNAKQMRTSLQLISEAYGLKLRKKTKTKR